MRIEIVYASEERQVLKELELEAGATVADAIRLSAIDSEYPQDDLEACEVGVWGQVVSRDARLSDGDRVELYRPLHMDPRDARRLRAKD